MLLEPTQKAPIEKIVDPVVNFLNKDYAAGLVLLLSVVAALVWANWPDSTSYHDVWHNDFGITFGEFVFRHPFHVWVNDGLMAVFFFVIGLELKREFMAGELSTFKKAMLPMVAAVGGMVVPAAIYLALNYDQPTVNGWGIPMATDIAFALALISLVGKGIPTSVKVFLSALAVADDLGAVLVIAFFYTKTIYWVPLIIGLLLVLGTFVANLMGVRSSAIYGLLFIAIWICFLMSGVHATIAGVLTAFCIPARPKIDEENYSQNLRYYVNIFDAEKPMNSTLTTPIQHQTIQKIKRLSLAAETPLQKLESSLHNWVSFLIMPIFALSNSGIHFSGDVFEIIKNPISMGIMLGLIVGKFVGVFGFTYAIVKTGFVKLPSFANWKHIAGVAMLAGVGFTMSLFISGLAFSNALYVEEAKYGILFSSVIAGTAGVLFLKSVTKKAKTTET